MKALLKSFLSFNLLLAGAGVSTFPIMASEEESIPSESNIEFYSLDDYANRFASSQEEQGYSSSFESPVAPLSLQALLQTQYLYDTASGEAVGWIQLQYQTSVVGGRPQFLYDTCYLSTPYLYASSIYHVTNSYFTFTGDCITVYVSYTDISGAFTFTAIANFYPA